MNKQYTYHISGTHCPSCKILIEDILSDSDLVKKVNVNLKSETIDIETKKEVTEEEIIKVLNKEMESYKYVLSTEKEESKKTDDEIIWKAIPIGIGFLVLFFILQKSGILNFGLGDQSTYLTSFIIGLIASVSSCLAIVGGLVLSLSAKVMKDNGKSTIKPFVLFHAGRILGFAFLGGVLGLIGKAIRISFMLSSFLGIIASTVMILLGLNLIGVIKKGTITLPNGIFNYFRKVEHSTFAPILIGIGTFFLPCGFTQSMQVAALSSGSFGGGMLIMFSFAIGTLPMLALLSFSSVSFAHSKYAPIFFKSAGIVVIGLGLFALLAGLAGIGIIKPLFNI